MNRRGTVFFLAVLGASPFLARAQQVPRVARIGYLSPTPASGKVAQELFGAFRAGLRDLGYVEGKNLQLEPRDADDDSARLPALAAELVGLKVDVIVTFATGVIAARGATTTIPIVMATSADPVALGFAASLARPGGNVTGFSVMSPDLAGKRLGLLKEMDPRIRRVAILLVPENPTSALQRSELQAAAKALKLKLVPVLVRQPEDFDLLLPQLLGRVDALFLTDDALLDGHRNRIGEFAIKHRLPSLCGYRPPNDTTCLMWYGPDLLHQYKSAASYVAKILGGVKPADLPVQQPTKFAFVINGRTAKALRIKIPQSFVLSADEIIN